MIHTKTVFVLGAGASYAYGFPTGEQLVEEIVGFPNRAETLELLMSAGDSEKDISCFVNDLAASDDASVDSFLEHRPEYLRIGKLAIVLSLIPKERDRTLTRKYRTHANNKLGQLAWYHYLWRAMAAPKQEFGANSVSFITFNYDRSLERYFFLALKAKHGYRLEGECLSDLYGIYFLHVYGSLGDQCFSEHPYGREISANELQRTAARLKVIHEELADTDTFSQAQTLLREANTICFLGYGFHELNNERLGLAEIARDDKLRRQRWFSSSYGMTRAEFSRKTRNFVQRFVYHNHGLEKYVGQESDGALEVLRKFEILN